MTECERVWSKFSRNNKDGKPLNFVIQTWPIEKLDSVLNFQLKYFVPEEAMHKAAGISDNEQALSEYRTIFSMLIKEKEQDIFVCCLEDDLEGENIIGVSIVEIMKKGETLPDLQIDTKEMMKLKKILFSLALEFDVAESLSVDEYYGAKGVCVRPDYRGLGIAQEFLRIRRLICKERNMPFTSAWMTAFGTQKAAARDGWKSVFELDLEKFGQQVDAVFKNTPPTFKFMIAKSKDT